MSSNSRLKGAKTKGIRLMLTAAAVLLLLGLWAAPASAVQNLTAQTGVSGQILLSWNRTLEGATVDFDIAVTPGSINITNHNGTNYTLSGLENGVEYLSLIHI